jgi:hypothetical protein
MIKFESYSIKDCNKFIDSLPLESVLFGEYSIIDSNELENIEYKYDDCISSNDITNIDNLPF